MREIAVNLWVDPKFKWIAMQPWGAWVLFTKKPKVYRAVEDRYEDGFVPCYWKQQSDEHELIDGSFVPPKSIQRNWRKSLRRL